MVDRPNFRSRRIRSVLAPLLLASCALPNGQEEFPTWFPAAKRVVAIGDLHGDLVATRKALRLAGAIDERDRWVGGRLVLVQTGDILDRGDDEVEILDFLDRLAVEALEAGGAVHRLNGNHELMNAYQDFRYVTEGGWADFADVPLPSEPDSALLALEPYQRGRAYSFRPGRLFALRLARQNTVIVIGETLFTHGGILPANLQLGLDSLNAAVRNWLRGDAPRPEWIRGEDSPVWTRLYSAEPTEEACATLAQVLEELDLQRMVVGHTVQRGGINPFCGGRVWAIDVGLAAHYGGSPEVLEIRGDQVRAIRLGGIGTDSLFRP
jgi:hypothetical protein